jgi:hypothetical protein
VAIIEVVSMQVRARVILIIAMLALSVVGQFAALAYMRAVAPLAPVQLAKPLDQLPPRLGGWQGTDVPIEDNPDFFDQQIHRSYCHANSGQRLDVWVRYSTRGEDRRHHPEVCRRVAGEPEQPDARRSLPVPGHAQPVQRFKFGHPEDAEWVFYWHYTDKGRDQRPANGLRDFVQQLRSVPASVTLVVSTPDRSADDLARAERFVGLLDVAIGGHLGPHAVRGSSRLPVVVVP